jgi:hypothetical protein
VSAATPIALVTNAQHSAASSEWFTPIEIVEAARRLMHSIDCDPASNSVAQRIVEARTYFTRETDGLLADWRGNVFLNPPTPPKEWWLKLMRHVWCGEVKRAIYIAYSVEQLSQSQGWSEKHSFPAMTDFQICIPRKRIHYMREVVGTIVRGAQPPHSSAIIGVNVGRADFAREFGGMGACL